MTMRINKHQEERGPAFITVEEPLYLAKAIKAVGEGSDVILIDCLTLWVNNLLYYFKDDSPKAKGELDSFLEVLADPPAELIMVTNEVGLGVIPENPLARTFVDELGFINQRVAQFSEEVIMMVAGCPQVIKGAGAYEPMDYSFSRDSSLESRVASKSPSAS